MSSLTLIGSYADDLSVVNAARVSLGKQVTEMAEGDDRLIHYLMKNRHGTPFEHNYFRFHVKAPIFVFREWQRHRVGHSYNEMSSRYVELEEEFYEPIEFRGQTGKPGAYKVFALEDDNFADVMKDAMRIQNQDAFALYRDLLAHGVAKEQARSVLPVGTMSQMIWSCNARSLMHFCALRNSPFALLEIRELAITAEDYLRQQMPITYEAFQLNGREAP